MSIAAEVRAFLADKLARIMTAKDWLSLVIVLICLLLSAFFAGSETALTASSRASMTRLEKHGNKRAGIVNRLLEQRERLLGALLFGNNAVNIAASALATGVLLAWFGHAGVLYATVVMTIIVVVFSEILPKTAAFNAPDRIALAVARPMSWFVTLFGPVLMAIEALVRWLLKHVGMTVGEDQQVLSAREELRGAVDLIAPRRRASRRSTATCSAACSICAISSSPT